MQTDRQPPFVIRPPERVVRSEWALKAQAARDQGAELLALWGSDDRDRGSVYTIRAALREPAGLRILELPVPADAPSFPSLAELFPAADRMERSLHDLLGVRAEGADGRAWTRHGAWPQERFPLRRDFDVTVDHAGGQDRYRFVQVEGDGVHEIAVGPVHAGIIEPGHFRFSVVGEKVLRLEERLGFTHKGIEKRFESLSLKDGQRLAARVSGDSAAAFSWAYCMAVEALAATPVPARADYLRALALERERIANHLGDLGALANDAGFGFGLAQFSRLKEGLLRLNAAVFGARYPMDFIIPGGVARDLSDELVLRLLEQGQGLADEVRALRDIYEDHGGVQDRFVGAGRVEPSLASRLGLTGLAGRASGQARDLRCDKAHAPYHALDVRMAVSQEGDVAARVDVRFDEALESLRLCATLLGQLPGGSIAEPVPAAAADQLAVGLVEGWRGPVFIALESAQGDGIRRCHAHDPSWQNWPVIEHAVIGNIVPDFPLINKSFNLSYSGPDL